MASPSNVPYIINLCNSIIGVAVLALPFCFKECGIILGLLLIIGSGWLTQKTCRMLLKVAFITKKRSYEFVALHVFGRYGKLIVEICIIGMLIGNCIAFYIIIGDLGPAIIAKLTNLENTRLLRSVVMSLLAIFVALPLGLLNSLERLSRYSAISLLFYGIFVVQVVVAALPNLLSGVWLSKVVLWNPGGMFKCVPIFALAFSCHGQLFIIYDSLPEASITRMKSIMQHGVTVCAAIYMTVGCFGYIVFFDEEISGDILMNFRPTLFSDFVKLGFVMSTVISFPLVIYPCRASVYTLLFTKEVEPTEEILPEKSVHDTFGALYIPPLHFKLITMFIIGVTLMIGILVPSVEFVLALTGATMGSLICYVLPASLVIAVATVNKGEGRAMAQIILFIGVLILLVSSFVTMTNQGGEDNLPANQESVIKRGHPIVHKEDEVAAASELENIIDSAAGGKVGEGELDRLKLGNQGLLSVNETKKGFIAADGKVVQIEKDLKEKETRQEPPNPRAPVEQNQQQDQISNKSHPPLENLETNNKLEKRDVDPNIKISDMKNDKQSDSLNIPINVDKIVDQVGVPTDKVDGVDSPQASVKTVISKKNETVKHVNINNAGIGGGAKPAETGSNKAENVSGVVNKDQKQAENQNVIIKEKAGGDKVVPKDTTSISDSGKKGVPRQGDSHNTVKPGDASHVTQKLEVLHGKDSHVKDKPVVPQGGDSNVKAKDVSHGGDSKVKDKPISQGKDSHATVQPGVAGEANVKPIDTGSVNVKPEEGGGEDAQKILEELKKQQEIQKQLIDEQRKIIEDLKEHHLQLHPDQPEAPAAQQSQLVNNEQQQQPQIKNNAERQNDVKHSDNVEPDILMKNYVDVENINLERKNPDTVLESKDLRISAMPILNSGLRKR